LGLRGGPRLRLSEIIEDHEEAKAHVLEAVKTFDPTLGETHPASVDDELVSRMVHGIVAFRMRVDRFEAKIKLNQNKKPQDRQNVMKTFLASSDPVEREVGRLIERLTV
jgi:transcriptional regulator